MGSLTQKEINVDLFDEVTRLRKENRELKEQLKPKKLYLVLEILDEGYDSVQTEIKLITFDEEKAKKTAKEDVNNWVKWVYETFENFYIKSPTQNLNSEYDFIN